MYIVQLDWSQLA